MLIKLFDLGICLFEGYMYFSFINNFLQLRRHKKYFPEVTIAIAMTCLFVVNQLHVAWLNFVASAILCIIASQILFVDSFRKKIFYVLLSSFIMVCCEFVMMGVYSLPLGNYTIQYSDDIIKMVIVILSTKLLALLVFKLLCHYSNSGRTVFFPSIIPYFCCFPISCLIMYIGITYSPISFKVMVPYVFIILCGSILLLLSNIVLFLLYDKMTLMMNCAKEYELIDIKRKIENQHYLQVEEINKKHSGILHDMNNYLDTIKILAEEENNEQIVGLINSLNDHIVKTIEELYCNNQIINAILNGKKQNALQKNVQYDVYVEPGFQKPEIQDIDLISIMSNLIDNAIEAASKCEKGVVDIQLYRANDGKFTTIKISNNFCDNPIERDGEFITRKGSSAMHGIGIRQVKNLVEQYGGVWDIEYDDLQFCITIMFA